MIFFHIRIIMSEETDQTNTALKNASQNNTTNGDLGIDYGASKYRTKCRDAAQNSLKCLEKHAQERSKCQRKNS